MQSRESSGGEQSDSKRSELNSVSNALAILGFLREVDEVGVADVAEHLHIGMSTAHRLLTTMRAQGYVRQIGSTRKYRLGPAMDGMRASAVYDDYVDIASDALEWLRDQTNETVHLAVLSGGIVRYLAAAAPNREDRVSPRIGTRLPAHACAAGKVLLAALPGRAFERLYPSPKLIGPSTRAMRTRISLQVELDLVRRMGFARDVGESALGIVGLAKPVREANGVPTLAILVSAPFSRLALANNDSVSLSHDEEHVLPLIGEAVRKAETLLWDLH